MKEALAKDEAERRASWERRLGRLGEFLAETEDHRKRRRKT